MRCGAPLKIIIIAVIGKSSSVLLCVLEQPRLDNSRVGTVGCNWLKDGPTCCGSTFSLTNTWIKHDWFTFNT